MGDCWEYFFLRQLKMLYIGGKRRAMNAALNKHPQKSPYVGKRSNKRLKIAARIGPHISQQIADWQEAFNNIKLYEQGKKQLKSARALLEEL